MVELTAKSACDGLLPISVGRFTLSEETPGALTSLMPFKGCAETLSQALEAAHGSRLPDANRSTGKAGAQIIWFAQNQYLLMGPEPAPILAEHAAMTDQTDAWAVVRLEGAGAEQVLARLIPLDLRPHVFEPGHTARSDLMHMMASVTRTGPQAFAIMVFRSMAATLVHDLQTAMEGVAARG